MFDILYREMEEITRGAREMKGILSEKFEGMNVKMLLLLLF